MKLSLYFSLLLVIPFFITSCKKSSESSSSAVNYAGPSQCLPKSSSLTQDIVGGTTVNGLSVPAGNNTVAILLNNIHDSTKTIICSGSVVASNLILTAGHCFDNVDLNSTSPGKVVFDNFYFSSNSANISCWQRSSNYIPCSVDNSYNCILNDIAWVKINGNVASFGYSAVSLLANPQAISSTETKWMAGFGALNDNTDNSRGLKYIVDTARQGNADISQTSGITTFNSQTSANAYQNYLTVIGPYSGHGTCQGDSGGPVYISRSSTYILAALTQGSNVLLTPHPTTTSAPYSFDTSIYATCQDGYGVYTTVGNYISWLTSTSATSVSTY